MKYFPRLYLNCHFEIVEVGDEVSAVSTGGDGNTYNGIILLKNESTRFMFEKLQKGISLPELIKDCMEKYTDSTAEEVGPKVLEFLDTMRKEGLLAEDRSRGTKIDD